MVFDHFAFFLVNNSSEKWCLSAEFLPFQLTRQCRGGPLGSWLPVARLAIPSHGEPARQGQGCQRENQATIRYLAACQVFSIFLVCQAGLVKKCPAARHEICQKFYTTELLGHKFYTLKTVTSQHFHTIR